MVQAVRDIHQVDLETEYANVGINIRIICKQ